MMSFISKILHTKYIPILWTAIIFILCTIPSQSLNAPDNSDKIAHLGVFIIFTFLWLFQTKKTVLIIILGIFYGIFIEFWQSILPESFHRSFDLWDAFADSIGVMIGWIFYMVFQKYFSKS